MRNLRRSLYIPFIYAIIIVIVLTSCNNDPAAATHVFEPFLSVTPSAVLPSSETISSAASAAGTAASGLPSSSSAAGTTASNTTSAATTAGTTAGTTARSAAPSTVSASPSVTTPVPSAETKYTFVWMTDTQYYSRSYPQIFDQMTQWITDKKEKLNIKYVFHTGDVINNRTEEYQWKNADTSMKKLDGKVNYQILAGNHDVGTTDFNYTTYLKYFGPERFKSNPYIAGYYKSGKGRYDLAEFGKTKYLFLSMGWDIDNEAVTWINNVLAKYPARIAILMFHNYMNEDGTLSESGQIIYDKIVIKNKNVRFVLCGHNHAVNKRISKIDDNGDGKPDRTVYQLLADYQADEKGGNGYLKVFTVDEKNKEIYIEPYSPYLSKYEFIPRNPKDPEKDTVIIPIDW